MEMIELAEKKKYYEQLKSKILSEDVENSIEIEQKVTEYKKQLIDEKLKENKNDLLKIDHYLELLNELIIEATDMIVNNEINESISKEDANVEV